MKTHEHHTAGFSKGDSSMIIPASWHSSAGSNDSGFTLVELIVVMAVLGVLALLAIPAYNGYVSLARNARTMSDIRVLEKEIDAYFIDKNVLPPDLNTIQRGNFLDAWKHPYVYQPVATAGPLQLKDGGIPLNTDFDLYSLGPDGLSNPDISQLDGQDDIIRAADGGYVGTGAGF
jgi:general secretion pathway protein G